MMKQRESPSLRSRSIGVLRRSLRYRGMLVLVIWQVPIQPVIRPNGSFGLMIGAGTAEQAELSCDGSLIQSQRVTYQTAAVQADYDVAERVRVDAAVGIARSDWGSHDGGFGAVQIRSDWRLLGIGLGVAFTPGASEYDTESEAWPSAHLRIGSAQRWHYRSDVLAPSALASQQIVRGGVGFNAVDRDRPAGFVGLGVMGLDNSVTGVAGEITVPVRDRVAVRAEAHYAPGHGHAVAGLAMGGRYLFGGGRRERPATRAESAR
jgi:hypothetical protein